MLIIPAIDIRNGKCIRLRQGSFDQETIYADDPIAAARKWQLQGAKALHLVDLDGAKSGQLTNLSIIKKITEKINLPIQVGGGIQSEEIIKELLSVGVKKVIIGTLALEKEDILAKLLSNYRDQIIVSLDSRNGKLTKRGWLNETEIDLFGAARKLEKMGVKQFIYTDVTKDGTLDQPNFEVVESLLKVTNVSLTIAGGVSSVFDLKRLKALNISGVIIGKALYENKISLEEANNVS